MHQMHPSLCGLQCRISASAPGSPPRPAWRSPRALRAPPANNVPNFKIPIHSCNMNDLKSNSQAGQDLFVVAMTQAKKNSTFLEIGAGHLKHGNNTYLLEKTFNWNGTSIDLIDSNTEPNEKSFWLKFYHNVRDVTWMRNPQSSNDLPPHIQDEIINVREYYKHLHKYYEHNLRRLSESVEYVPKFYNWRADRPLTNFIQHDALTLDYSFLPEKIDYLQVDIDPPMANLEVLNLVLAKTKFSVITFEHDLWHNTQESHYVRAQSRKLLKNYGYELLVNDVTIEPDEVHQVGDGPIYFEDWYVHPDEIQESVRNAYKFVTDSLFPKYYTEILFDNARE